ncbi:MAG: HU family DNA-binding protein, partial [Microgenomates group bacterium]
MTKKQLVDRVAKKVGLTKKTSESAVNAVFG